MLELIFLKIPQVISDMIHKKYHDNDDYTHFFVLTILFINRTEN